MRQTILEQPNMVVGMTSTVGIRIVATTYEKYLTRFRDFRVFCGYCGYVGTKDGSMNISS